MSTPIATVNPQRTIAELKELRALTGNEDGAQRVAFTPMWVAARKFLREKLAAIAGLEVHQDAGGNLWATLRGKSEKALLIGGHIDSVPNGGWLDGCLNVLAGVEVLRRMAAEFPASAGGPPVTVRLVDWADEEGARFGRSLFGSSAFSGALVADEVRGLKDKDGVTLPEAIRPHGIDLDKALEARAEQKNAAAYLELHIEQGPVLESKNLPMGVVLGTFGVERHAITFTGQAAHSGSTPMAYRKDALGGVSKLHLAIRDIAVRHGGVCTVGSVITKPGIVTSVIAEAIMTLDQRHLHADTLADMYQEAVDASHRIAAEEKIQVAWKKIWTIQPFPFHPHLIELAAQSIEETCGMKRVRVWHNENPDLRDAVADQFNGMQSAGPETKADYRAKIIRGMPEGEMCDVAHRLPSGPLHDAAEVCRTGIPTIMLFVQSLRGISHNKIEDTKEEHLELSVRARWIDWLTKPSLGLPVRLTIQAFLTAISI